jgi:hypothetical protein
MMSSRQSAALNPPGPDFSRFLYAEVGDDQQGGLLSVISALARVGVDPWDEAASLTRLPLNASVQALSALLARLPAGSGKPPDPVTVAARLVTLLPREEERPTPVPRAATTANAASGHNYRLMAVVGAIFILLFMLTQQLIKHRGTRDTAPVLTPASPATDIVQPGPGPASRQN